MATWDEAVHALLYGPPKPKPFFPLEISPDTFFKSAADVQKTLGLDTIPETKKARLIDINDTVIENEPEVTYVTFGSEHLGRIVEGFEPHEYKRIMIDGNPRRMYAPMVEREMPSSPSD